jgi:ectoine hydroxylase-related dioxygenase (phytanoyl-CoA dioxygenase family)
MLREKIISQRDLPPGFDLDRHMGDLDTQGFTVIEDYLSPAQLQRFRDALAPYLGTYRGRNTFEGLLAPNYLLSADHAICIYPGENAQSLHHDDGFYPFPRPRPAISISTIGAIDAFTPENGGTVMYPGSHKWTAERCLAVRMALARGETTADTACVTYLTMPAGAICVFQGTLLHGAGANNSDAPRLAYTNHYCEPWARPQENFYLGVPKERVRGMSREMQILLGYELLEPGSIMGQVGGYNPGKTLNPDFVLPVER